jgi:hypothetical protein
LNLDAEHELEAAGAYAPTRHLAELVARESRRLVGVLVAPGDVVLDPEPSARDALARGLEGIAWCPTPRALARLARAGAILPPAPSVDILRAVNQRAFATGVRAALEPVEQGSFEKHLGASMPHVLELLARPASDGWLVRRPFGAAGRGRRRIAAGRPDAAERAWIAAGLRRGPLLVEPWVRVRREFTRCGWVDPSGEVVIAPPCFQVTTPQGAWTKSEAAEAGALSRADDARLQESVEAAGRDLARAGYFGPYGIDAYRHSRPGRAAAIDVLNPMSEINARYTMDWSLGSRELPRLTGCELHSPA